MGWITGLKPGKAQRYKELHANPWPGVLQTLKDCNVQNFSIYTTEIEGRQVLVAYLEYSGVDFENDMARMAADPETQRWWKETDLCQEPLPQAMRSGKVWADMEEVFYLA